MLLQKHVLASATMQLRAITTKRHFDYDWRSNIWHNAHSNVSNVLGHTATTPFCCNLYPVSQLCVNAHKDKEQHVKTYTLRTTLPGDGGLSLVSSLATSILQRSQLLRAYAARFALSCCNGA